MRVHACGRQAAVEEKGAVDFALSWHVYCPSRRPLITLKSGLCNLCNKQEQAQGMFLWLHTHANVRASQSVLTGHLVSPQEAWELPTRAPEGTHFKFSFLLKNFFIFQLPLKYNIILVSCIQRSD